MARAKKEKRAKKVPSKKYTFYGINVKVRSEEKKGEALYLDVFQRLYDTVGKGVHISKDKGMAVKSHNVQKLEEDNNEISVITGTIVRYELSDGDAWYNDEKREVQKVDLPKNVHPGTVETEYVFIPSAHRFYFLTNSRISKLQLLSFFKLALPKAINENQDFEVDIITGSDAITRILTADKLKSLKIHVSYSNDDLNDKSIELVDKMVKDTLAKSLDLNFQSKKSMDLNQKSELIEGALGLAKENGSATAKIVEGNKTKTVHTVDYPKKTDIIRPKDEPFIGVLRAFAKKIFNEYRNIKN